jgi:hypothetical protein
MHNNAPINHNKRHDKQRTLESGHSYRRHVDHRRCCEFPLARPEYRPVAGDTVSSTATAQTQLETKDLTQKGVDFRTIHRIAP